MAIGVGVTTKGRSASTLSQVTGSVTTQAAGSIFVGAQIYSRNTSTFSTIADSKSNSYTIIAAQQNFETVNGAARLYYKENATGGAGTTLTFANTGTAGPMTDFLLEITGGLTASALDTGFTSVNDVASPFTASITPTAGNRLLVAFFAGNSGSNPATHAESSGFTVQASCNETDGTQFWTGCLATRIVAADGVTAYTVSFTETGGSDTAVFIAAFKEAATADALMAQVLM